MTSGQWCWEYWPRNSRTVLLVSRPGTASSYQATRPRSGGAAGATARDMAARAESGSGSPARSEGARARSRGWLLWLLLGMLLLLLLGVLLMMMMMVSVGWVAAATWSAHLAVYVQLTAAQRQHEAAITQRYGSASGHKRHCALPSSKVSPVITPLRSTTARV